ncbi:MAG: AAA family ATPase [Bacteroidia bacterium]|nr:AAA family ATPase [Bacteroidia bacterium]
MKYRPLYIAATSQHVGKTTSTLGLVHTLREMGVNVGYCKPVGQQFVEIGPSRADKDALLFASSMNFELQPDLHSPVILGDGATMAYIDHPEEFQFANRLMHAAQALQEAYDIVVYEGTGHPGVGSVVGLSNDRVAEMLDAGVIMVVEAGVGNTIDRLYLNLAPFQQRNIRILGVIINKAIPEKIDKVRRYVGQILEERNIPLLGIMPYEEELGFPVMYTIAQTLRAQILFNEDMLDNKVKGIIAGSLIDLNEAKNFQNQLLVVSINRLGEAMRKLEEVARILESETSPLSGIILTGRGDLTPAQTEYFIKHRIPVLMVKLDTYEAVIKISRIEVKINTRTPWKVKKAVDIFREHVNMAPLMEAITS